jgi:hypothetical protein
MNMTVSGISGERRSPPDHVVTSSPRKALRKLPLARLDALIVRSCPTRSASYGNAMPCSAFSSSNSIWWMVASLVSAIIAPNPPPLTADRRRCRVLELEPVRRAAGAIARPEPLGDDALAAELAGVLKHDHALRMFKVFVQAQARSGLAQDARERGLARLDRLAPQVGAVELCLCIATKLNRLCPSRVTSGPPHWASHVRFRRVQTWSVSHAILLCLGICPCRKPNREDRAFARPARYCHVAAQLAGDGETQAGSPEPLGGSWHRPDSFACRSVVMPMPVSAAGISMPHVRRTGFAP